MALSNFFLKKFQKMDHLFVLFCQSTRIPYVECDPETFDDQVYVFTSEEKAKEMVRNYLEEKQQVLDMAKLPNNRILPFLAGLYAFGVNAVLLQEEDSIRIPLERLAKQPDIGALKNDKIPRVNPDLQLTCLYFLQEARRKVKERSKEDMKRLHDMEEEMSVNLFRSRFIIPIDLSATGGKLDPKNPNYKMPLLKLQNGDSYIPCFSDVPEFQKFNLKNQNVKFSLIALPYDALGTFSKQAKGVILNPAGLNLILSRELMDKLKKSYGQNEEG